MERIPRPRLRPAAGNHGRPPPGRPPQRLRSTRGRPPRFPLCRGGPAAGRRPPDHCRGGRMRLLVTGSAGFIGFHLARRLLADGHVVVGFDGMTPYYDVGLKQARHAILARSNGFTAVTAMLEDADALKRAADLAAPDVVVHLAAQAGVRYSLENPRAYLDANLVGSWNLLD